MATLLVVDDEPAILHAFGRVFRAPDVTILTAATATEGIEAVAQHHPDVVILDIQLPDFSGLEAFLRIQKLDPKVPVIFITGHGTTETAIEATKRGAFDYLFKPLELAELQQIVDSALRISRLQRVAAVVPGNDLVAEPADVLVGRCPAMNEVYKAIGRVAPQDVTVLITGESGTGKELVARAVYHHSLRSDRQFLEINCAAIPDSLLESELFGHEKGAFTGAERQRIGKFEQCSGGTLFMDEIGDMSLVTQAKFLRVLAAQRFQRVGGNHTVQSDVRIIAVTNQNLDEMVASDSFRGDLYYRLSVFTIVVPPLRERGGDVQLLAEHFLKQFNRELGKDVHEIAPDALELLSIYSWPGNVRELQSVLKQALLQAVGPVLVAEFLPAHFHASQDIPKVPRPGAVGGLDEWDQFVSDRLREGSENLHGEWLALCEHHLLTRVLQHTSGNLSHAARILGINRRTLRTKLHALNVKFR